MLSGNQRETKPTPRPGRIERRKRKKRLDTELAPETLSADSKACCVKFWLLPGAGIACSSAHFPFSLLRFWSRAEYISLRQKEKFRNRRDQTQLIHYRTGSLGTFFFRLHKYIKSSTCKEFLLRNPRAVSTNQPCHQKGDVQISHLTGSKGPETDCVNNHHPAHVKGSRKIRIESSPFP